MTALAPLRFATEIAVVMPRSLNDAGRVQPLELDEHLGPGQLGEVLARDERRTALLEGHDGRAVQHRQAVGVLADHAAPLVRHGSGSFHTHDGGDVLDGLEAGEGVDGGRERGIRGPVGDDDELGRARRRRARPAGAPSRSTRRASANAAATWASTPGRSATSRLMWYLVRDWPMSSDRQVGVGRLPRAAPAGHLVPGHRDDVAEHGGCRGVATRARARRTSARPRRPPRRRRR